MFNTTIFLLLTFFILPALQAGESLKEKFSDVLLVIHYNHPFYSSIPFLKNLYGSAFPNIVFYGEQIDPEVTAIETYYGHHFQRVVQHVLTHYPEYTGYLFVQDDVLMNVWNFTRFDKNKVWFPANHPMEFIQQNLVGDSMSDWCWWNSQCGLTEMRPAIAQLTAQERHCLEHNHGPNRVVGQMVDCFYLPARLAVPTAQLCGIFSDVFCEMAIPTLLSCVDDAKTWEQLSFLWVENCDATVNRYKPTYDWLHPLKFSQEKYRHFATQIFNQQPIP